jgi:hypothetical protein
MIKTPRPSSSEKLIPSESLPPTTERRRAPLPVATAEVYSARRVSVVVVESRDS